jgi:hypothetical protein
MVPFSLQCLGGARSSIHCWMYHTTDAEACHPLDDQGSSNSLAHTRLSVAKACLAYHDNDVEQLSCSANDWASLSMMHLEISRRTTYNQCRSLARKNFDLEIVVRRNKLPVVMHLIYLPPSGPSQCRPAPGAENATSLHRCRNTTRTCKKASALHPHTILQDRLLDKT